MSSALEIVGTRPVASLHRRSVVKDIADTTVSYATSSVPKMHKAELKAEAQTESVKSKNSAMKGTMIIMVLTTTNLTGTVTRSGHIPGGIKAYSLDLKQVRWPVNLKPSGIEKYDGSTNSAKWLQVYQLTIEAARGDAYVMANYLPVCLSSSARTWILRLAVRSV
jgi:hypothetical protein